VPERLSFVSTFIKSGAKSENDEIGEFRRHFNKKPGPTDLAVLANIAQLWGYCSL
jgi:hypothetical protein